MQSQQVFMINGARVTTDCMLYLIFFFFTVNSDTATTGNIKGGGLRLFRWAYNNKRMINKIWNWIKNIFKPQKQDPHLEMYEEARPDKVEKIRRKYGGDSK